MADILSTQTDNALHPENVLNVPFRVYVRLVPKKAFGRRWEAIRDKQKVALAIEAELVSAGYAIPGDMVIESMSTGIKHEMKIVGFHRIDRTTTPNAQPLADATVIHPGTVPGESTSVMTGSAGVQRILTHDRESSARLEEGVAQLKAALLSDSATLAAEGRIERIEYNGVLYGKGARSFPV